jgi:hypothetical protein
MSDGSYIDVHQMVEQMAKSATMEPAAPPSQTYFGR